MLSRKRNEKEEKVPKAAFDTTASVIRPVLTESRIFKGSFNIDIVEPKFIKNWSGSDYEGFRFDEMLWNPSRGDTPVLVDG